MAFIPRCMWLHMTCWKHDNIQLLMPHTYLRCMLFTAALQVQQGKHRPQGHTKQAAWLCVIVSLRCCHWPASCMGCCHGILCEGAHGRIVPDTTCCSSWSPCSVNALRTGVAVDPMCALTGSWTAAFWHNSPPDLCILLLLLTLLLPALSCTQGTTHVSA